MVPWFYGIFRDPLARAYHGDSQRPGSIIAVIFQGRDIMLGGSKRIALGDITVGSMGRAPYASYSHIFRPETRLVTFWIFGNSRERYHIWGRGGAEHHPYPKMALATAIPGDPSFCSRVK